MAYLIVCSLSNKALFQKRPIILSVLLTKATPYQDLRGLSPSFYVAYLIVLIWCQAKRRIERIDLSGLSKEYFNYGIHMVCPEYRLFHRALLQKRTVILRSLLMVVSNGICLTDRMGFIWCLLDEPDKPHSISQTNTIGHYC